MSMLPAGAGEGGAGFDPDRLDLDALERRYRDALGAGTSGDLDVVGYGEISLGFAWPPDEPTTVVKSMPVFTDLDRLRAYAALVAEYVGVLEGRGVPVLPTVVRWTAAPGGWRGWLLQPRCAPATVGPAVLAVGDGGQVLLEQVVGHVLAVVDDRVGLDAQVSNWVLTDGRVRYLDVGTPMLRDAAGADRLDVGILVTAVPAILRPMVQRLLAPGLLAVYHDPRRTILDVAGNLVRERLEGWIPRLLAVANPYLDPPLEADEVHRFYRGNARMYAALQAMRRLDRAWTVHVRHRPYPFLLPAHYQR
jgi:hypothetical protein